MKKIIPFIFAAFFINSCATAQEITLEEYLLDYDYDARKDMKIYSEQLVQLLQDEEVQLVDIRFTEEFQCWNMPFAINIPLADLPNNLDKLDPNKIIVTACPHKDRAIIAMTYLKTKGYNVKYLADGLIGLAEYLRGNNAYNFINE